MELMDSPEKIGNVDANRVGRAIGFARQAVPAFIEFHERLTLGEVDGEHVERAYVHANGASLVRDALVLVDLDGDFGAGHGHGHSWFSSGSDGLFGNPQPLVSGLLFFV